MVTGFLYLKSTSIGASLLLTTALRAARGERLPRPSVGSEEHQGGREVPLKIAALRVGAGVIEAKDEIWEREIFTRPPRNRKDCWIDVFLDEGWLV